MLDIDGILTGTIVTDMSLSQQTIWFRMLGLAGKGHGRVGFIERAVDVGFSRDALYGELRIYTAEHKQLVDETLEICIGGNDPRIKMFDNGVIEILKWDKYQFLAKGTTRDTTAERRHRQLPLVAGNPQWNREPISPTIQDAKEKKQTAIGVVRQQQTAVDALGDQGLAVVDKHTGVQLPTTKEKHDNHDGED